MLSVVQDLSAWEAKAAMLVDQANSRASERHDWCGLLLAICGGVVSGSALIFLAGWLLGVPSLVQLVPGGPAIHYLTAVAYLLIGSSYLATSIERPGLAAALTGGGAAIGLAVLLPRLFGFEDDLGTRAIFGLTPAMVTPPATVSSATAFALATLGMGHLGYLTGGHRQTPAWLVSTLGSLLLALFGVRVLWLAGRLEPSQASWLGLTGMSLQTVALGLVSASSLFLAPMLDARVRLGLWPRWFPWPVLVLGFANSFTVWMVIDETQRSQIDERSAFELGGTRLALEREIDAKAAGALRMSHRLAARFYASRVEWEADARQYLETEDFLLALSWLDAGLREVWTVASAQAEGLEAIVRVAARAGAPNEVRLTRAQRLVGGVPREELVLVVPCAGGRQGWIVAELDAEGLISRAAALGRSRAYVATVVDEAWTVLFADVGYQQDADLGWGRGARLLLHGLPLRLAVAPSESFVTRVDGPLPELFALGVAAASILVTLLLIAMQQAQARRAELQDLYEHAAVGYHSLDEGGRFIRINQTELDWLGYERDELIGRKTFPDLLTEAGRESFAERFPKFKASGVLRDADFEVVRRDGSIMHVIVNATISVDEHGRYRYSRSTVSDVTALRESQQLLELALTAGGIGLWWVDVEGREAYYSPSLKAQLGYADDEIQNRPDELAARLHQDDRQAVLDKMSAFMRAPMIGHEVEYRLKCKDGSWRWFMSRARLQAATKDRRARIVGISIDINRRKHEEEKLRGLMNAAPDAMLIIAESGCIQQANEQALRLFGYERQELEGLQVERLVPDELQLEHQALRKRYSAAAELRAVAPGRDLKARRKDGSSFPVEIELSPFMSESGMLVTVAARDVTERKRVERQLQEAKLMAEAASVAKSEFLAGMSREIRRPLGVVLSCAELLRAPETPEAERQRLVGAILRNGKGLLALLDDIPDLSKVEAGKIESE